VAEANSNGNGLIKDPVWARVVATLGFPIVMALLLFAVVTGFIGSPITRTEAMLNQHMRGEDERTRILRVMCRNTAVLNGLSPTDCDWPR
jgi:hypothetical protein